MSTDNFVFQDKKLEEFVANILNVKKVVLISVEEDGINRITTDVFVVNIRIKASVQ